MITMECVIGLLFTLTYITLACVWSSGVHEVVFKHKQSVQRSIAVTCIVVGTVIVVLTIAGIIAMVILYDQAAGTGESFSDPPVVINVINAITSVVLFVRLVQGVRVLRTV